MYSSSDADFENSYMQDTTIRYRLTNGTYHREDGPAIIHPNGAKEWYINGERHREDGPAIVSYTGKVFWFIKGEQILQSDLNKWMSEMNINTDWKNWTDDEKMWFKLRFI